MGNINANSSTEADENVVTVTNNTNSSPNSIFNPLSVVVNAATSPNDFGAAREFLIDVGVPV